MGFEKVERDLAFIKKTMEAATRYDNIPPLGYLLTGAIGLAGVLCTYVMLGPDVAGDLQAVSGKRAASLGIVWGGVLLLAVGMLVITAKIHARRRGITAWNSLATRMFASQLPLAIAGALLTVGLALERQVSFVPAIWLLLYGVIEFSFSYFSGRDHQVVGIGFLGLGAAALFGPGTWGLPLLGVGFGGLHIALGTFRMVRGKAK